MRLSRCLSVSGDRLLLLLAATLAIALVQAERDFNVNDSQVPVIEPKDVPAYKQDPYVTELMGCQNQQNEIELSLLLKKHDWSELTATKRAHVQAKLAKFFASFMIGCGPSYFVMGEPIAKQIAHQVKDGTIGALTEENFGLWFIWRKELKSRSHRRRRQSEGSGADDDDYEYEDEGEDAIEPSTEVPAVTTHAHRHHHGVEGEADAISTPNNNSSGSGSGNNEQLFPGSSVPPSTVATKTPATPEATSTVSTFSSTDYVEPQPENSVPIIKTRLQKLAVTSGKAFTMIVPEDTFWDAEDQGNLRLELTDKDGHELKSNSWLQFNADKRELYGLPLDDTVSRWQYRLSATDSGNATVTETVEISVQQHRAVRTITHEISILVKINEKHGHNIDWQLKLINDLARTLDDDSSSAVVVREICQTPQDPHSAIFVYFNETLPTSDCPEKELSDLVSRLDAQRLSDLVQPLLGIKSITGQLLDRARRT
ncbi:dystroglycan-like isoform X5 [Drosophila miranda]|uniref:dystroglycan-like isoform X5 n=1 Tax=Drosophila miranda TaxID=7229 RepID=UPI00143F0CA2|nr:dystroglycan-like isoform X5 [Drosophila miranda]